MRCAVHDVLERGGLGRDYVLADALQTCYGVLNLNFLVTLSQVLLDSMASNHWQPAEAALFALRFAKGTGMAVSFVTCARTDRSSVLFGSHVFILITFITPVAPTGLLQDKGRASAAGTVQVHLCTYNPVDEPRRRPCAFCRYGS